jgi:hypothetical protein
MKAAGSSIMVPIYQTTLVLNAAEHNLHINTEWGGDINKKKYNMPSSYFKTCFSISFKLTETNPYGINFK